MTTWAVPVDRCSRRGEDERWLEMALVDGYIAVTTNTTNEGTWGLKVSSAEYHIGSDWETLFETLCAAYFGSLTSVRILGLEGADEEAPMMWERVLWLYGFSYD